MLSYKQGSGVALRLLNYINTNSDSAFGYNDEELIKKFPEIKPNTINWALWLLFRQERIKQFRVKRHVYYCSEEALERFREKTKKEATKNH